LKILRYDIAPIQGIWTWNVMKSCMISFDKLGCSDQLPPSVPLDKDLVAGLPVF
jgi:hypothetical protein